MRLVRSAFLSALISAVSLGGAAAQAAAPAPGVIHGTANHQSAAQTKPVRLVPPGAPRPAATRSGANANQQSYNWSGYEAGGGYYTSVAARWTVPQTYCTSNGYASFWVGLDGFNDSTVEQTGTGVNCSTGTPTYYAWWETFPAPPQSYPDTVRAGDALSASVTYSSGTYRYVLADSTQGWQETTTVAAPAGSANASAEVIAESPGNSSNVLPDFGAADFTASTINGCSLQAANAQPIDMINTAGSLTATASGYDTTGDFSAFSQGVVAGSFEAAYKNNGGSLSTYTAAGYVNLGQATAGDTNPSVTAVSGGHETAFQNSSGYLSLNGSAGNVNTPLGMMAGTSPSITTLTNGSYVVAFQANNGYLWTYSPAAGGTQIPLGMMSCTSPSIAALANGSYVVAFAARNSHVWIYSSAGGGYDLAVTATLGSSPAVTAVPTGYQIAYQNYGASALGFLGSLGGLVTQQGMPTPTTPAISR